MELLSTLQSRGMLWTVHAQFIGLLACLPVDNQEFLSIDRLALIPTNLPVPQQVAFQVRVSPAWRVQQFLGGRRTFQLWNQ
jgi:hypothetical protein